MVKDMFGHEHPPSSCCGAPILRSSGPGFEHLICDSCKRVIKDLTKKKEPERELTEAERGRLAAIVQPPIELTNKELEIE